MEYRLKELAREYGIVIEANAQVLLGYNLPQKWDVGVDTNNCKWDGFGDFIQKDLGFKFIVCAKPTKDEALLIGIQEAERHIKEKNLEKY